MEETACEKEYSMFRVEDDILNMGLWQKKKKKMSLNRLSWDKILMDLV